MAKKRHRAARKSPTDKQSSRAGKTLGNKRASKVSKSLAATVLALDTKKGPNRKKRRARR